MMERACFTHRAAVLLAGMLLLFGLALQVSANSAEPPSLVLIVSGGSEELELHLRTAEGETFRAERRKTAWETYYVLYRHDIPGDSLDGAVLVYRDRDAAGGEIPLDPLELRMYSNVLTLDLKTGALAPGKLPGRTALLVFLRVMLTLLVEGAVFWAFGFRQRRSWVCFLAINLATQTCLNLALNAELHPVSAYPVMLLLFFEFWVFLAELVFFQVAVKERKRAVRAGYVLLANTASLVLGGVLITALPV